MPPRKSFRAPNGNKPQLLKEIAKLIGGEVVGDGNIRILGICGIREAKPGDLSFVANSKYLNLLESTKASAVITSRDVKRASKPIIRTENPSLAFAKLVGHFVPAMEQHPRGVSPEAVVGPRVQLGRDVAVQAFAVIEEGATIVRIGTAVFGERNYAG